MLEHYMKEIPTEKGFKEDLISLKEVQNMIKVIENAASTKDYRQAAFQTSQLITKHCTKSEKLQLDLLEYYVLNNNIDEAVNYSQQIFNQFNNNPRYLVLRGNIYVS